MHPEELERLYDELEPIFYFPRLVGVFDAQNKFAVIVLCPEPVKERGAQIPNMRRARRRGGVANANVSHSSSKHNKRQFTILDRDAAGKLQAADICFDDICADREIG